MKTMTLSLVTLVAGALVFQGCRQVRQQEAESIPALNHPALIALHQALYGNMADALDHAVVELEYYSKAEEFTEADVRIKIDGCLDDTFRGEIFEFKFARDTQELPWKLVSLKQEDILWPKLGDRE